ncbi:hypothetical protein [Helicobacter canis]|uniref:hypothetical protein n=1 Tax=Helicobacter canis TaxID=29419 RepID=UPI000554DCE9|nr:hypothetical protein [Helicobacter canis]
MERLLLSLRDTALAVAWQSINSVLAELSVLEPTFVLFCFVACGLLKKLRYACFATRCKARNDYGRVLLESAFFLSLRADLSAWQSTLESAFDFGRCC